MLSIHNYATIQYNNVLSIHIMLMLLSSKNNFLDTVLPEVFM